VILLGSVGFEQSAELRDRFRGAGIPILLEPDYARKGQIALGAPNRAEPDRVRVHVCIEEQIDEARRLFADPDYVVQHPVDIEEFDAAMERVGAGPDLERSLPDMTMNWIVGGMLLALVIGGAIYLLASL
jgi:hypothetical protein